MKTSPRETNRHLHGSAVVAVACAAALASPATQTATVHLDDDTGFLPTYSGPRNADLDVLSATATAGR